MTEIRKLAPRVDESPTKAGKFLAKRGHVVMKQFREMGKVHCEYGSTMTVSTLLFAIAQGNGGERTFGLKIEHVTRDGLQESCLLDFDEIKELLLAIKHLLGLAKATEQSQVVDTFSAFKVAKTSASEQVDYTEFQYITRDSLKVGFYQDTDGRQQAFFVVSPCSDNMFLGFDELRLIFEVLKKGRECLIEKGAGSDS